MEVKFDGKTRLEVYVPDSMKDQMCGLCGNYNDDPDDDWLMGAGQCPTAANNPPGTQVNTNMRCVHEMERTKIWT